MEGWGSADTHRDTEVGRWLCIWDQPGLPSEFWAWATRARKCLKQTGFLSTGEWPLSPYLSLVKNHCQKNGLGSISDMLWMPEHGDPCRVTKLGINMEHTPTASCFQCAWYHTQLYRFLRARFTWTPKLHCPPTPPHPPPQAQILWV